MTSELPDLDDLEDGFAERGDETRAEVVARLRSHGVDTRAFLERVDQVVQAAECTRRRSIAEQEMGMVRLVPAFLKDLSSRSFEEAKMLFNQIAQGEYGDSFRELAIARCREKGVGDFTETELRSWLEDLTDVIGGRHE